MAITFFSIAHPEYLGDNDDGIEMYKIDMNLAPKYRFQETSLHYKDKVRKVIDAYLSFVPDILIDVINHVGSVIHWINPEYYEEVDGMAYNLELDTGLVMFMQYVYEFSAFCTSVVAR